MASIIMCILFIVAILIALITCIYKREFGASISCFLILIIFGGLLVISINGYKYGSYSDLVTKYGMVHSGSEASGTYVKDNLVFNHRSFKEEYEDVYSITDYGDMNLNLHSKILDYFVNFKEGAIQLLVNHLKEYSEHYETNSEVTITLNHTRIEIIYHYRNNELNYKITVVKQYRWITDDDDNTIKETNSKYNYRFVEPELRIKHYNDDYQEFDKELVDLIFNKDISDSKVEKNSINGINKLSYSFKGYCTGNY